jgi:hypothetical protein
MGFRSIISAFCAVFGLLGSGPVQNLRDAENQLVSRIEICAQMQGSSGDGEIG